LLDLAANPGLRLTVPWFQKGTASSVALSSGATAASNLTAAIDTPISSDRSDPVPPAL